MLHAGQAAPAEAGSYGGGSPRSLTWADSQRTVAGLLLIYLVGVWLLTHWYRGVTHDAVLYAGQALARLYPVPLRQDLFLAYGSQDDYTLFTSVFAGIAARLTIGDAAILLVFLAHIAWVTAAIAVARRLAAGPALWIGLVLVFGSTGVYGPERIFSYGEGFATARIWAEVFVLLAVLSSLAGRRFAAVLCCLAGLAMHPIIALAGVGFVAFHGFPWRRILALAAAAAAVAALVATLDGPFAQGLRATMDPAWLEIAARRAPYVFLDRWPLADLNEILCLFVLLGTVALASTPRSRRIWLALLATLAVGLAFSAVAASTHHALLVQMQTWRVLWLVRLLAPLAAAWLAFEYWPKGRTHRMLLLWLAIGWLAKAHWGGPIALAALALFLWRERKTHAPPSPLVMRLSWMVLAAVSLIALLSQAQEFMIAIHHFRVSADPSQVRLYFDAYAFYLAVAMFGAGIFLVLLAPLWYAARASVATQWLAYALVCAFALAAALHWDQRTPADRDLYANLGAGMEPLADHFPEQAVIYWQDAVQYTWFILHRRNYVSGEQAVSALFSREAAIEVDRRLVRLARLKVQDSQAAWDSPPVVAIGGKPRSLPLDGLVHVCHDPQLDFVVLHTELGQGLARRVVRADGWTRFVYDCSRIRRALPDPFAGGSGR